jgi:hypothetical protein
MRARMEKARAFVHNIVKPSLMLVGKAGYYVQMTNLARNAGRKGRLSTMFLLVVSEVELLCHQETFLTFFLFA